ncbi:MAG TPA: glucosamine-6-phosphate deaminase [Terriglobales bacterium]
MKIEVFQDKKSLAQAAATDAANALRKSIQQRGSTRIIAATGAAQFEFLELLTQTPGIDWSKVEMFHLDEYIGIFADHPASFRKFLLERLINKTGINRYHLLDGDRDPEQVIAAVTAEIREAPIDIAFVGIGENGHLAFNDPPADFESEEAYIVVELDEACRRQQLGEGWFKTLDDVPRRAISMTVQQVLKAKQILAIVPDTRKAPAIAKCFGGDISPMAPASILRTHPHTVLYLDQNSAALLNPETITTLSA